METKEILPGKGSDIMAQRPWVTPKEVKDYTEHEKAKERADNKLKIDISRAEQYVIRYTNNRFDTGQYPNIPEEVKNAVILIAEAYAYNASKDEKKIKSETFDDYSYTLSDDSGPNLDNIDLGALLDDYVIVLPKRSVTMSLRKL